MKNKNGKVLAIIPARGGSKGIPRKNIVPLGGVPLVAWSIQAALQAPSVSRVIVSTEDEEIADIARQWGADVPFLRPEELAGDKAVISEAVEHLVSTLESQGEFYEAIVTLYPTHPFRTPEIIEEAVSACLYYAGQSYIVVPRMWNLGNWMGRRNGNWEFMRSSEPFLAYQSLGSLIATLRWEKEITGESTDEMIRFRTRMSREGDVRFYYGVKFVPITHSCMAADIDTIEDLEAAEQLIQDGTVPWTPRQEESTPREVPQIELHECTQVTDRYFVHHLLEGGKTSCSGSVQIPGLVTPSEVRKLIDEQSESRGEAIYIAPTAELEDVPAKGDRPVLWLDGSRRHPSNIQTVYHVPNFFQGLVPKEEEGPFETWFGFGFLVPRIKDSQISVVLTAEPQEGDNFVIGQLNEATSYSYVSEDTIYRNGVWQGTLIDLLGDRESYPVSGKGRHLSWHYSGEASSIKLRMRRPGSGPLGEPETTPLFQIEGWLEFDKSIQRWINKVEDKVVSGRQDLPPIYEWSGRCFLPATVADDEQWCVIVS